MKTYFYQLEKYKPINEHKLENYCIGFLFGLLIIYLFI